MHIHVLLIWLLTDLSRCNQNCFHTIAHKQQIETRHMQHVQREQGLWGPIFNTS